MARTFSKLVPRELSSVERQGVLAALHEPRFEDLAPAEVYATLLDAGKYLCSERTLYRVLDENREVRERRNQLRHPAYAAPELLATAPNQLWSWDITKLMGPVKWTYFYLYVILDVFSRHVCGLGGSRRGVRCTGAQAHQRDLRAAAHQAWTTDHSRRPWLFDEVEARGTVDGGHGRDEESLTPSRFGRQPVFGSPVQDAQVPA